MRIHAGARETDREGVGGSEEAGKGACKAEKEHGDDAYAGAS